MIDQPTETPVTTLLTRMRAGDRAAAAEFMERFGPRIRRRIRGKLNPSMRRLFDSEEVLSTLGRRLDNYVRNGSLRAVDEAQLWALLFKAADNALIDRRRAVKRLQAAESCDGPLAQALLSRMAAPEDEYGEVELERVYAALVTREDREILSLWLTETPSNVVAELVGMSPEGVRKRWERIKDHLRLVLEPKAA